MLSTFEVHDASPYVIWSTECERGLNITATDGQKVWHSASPVTANDKPASRKHDSDESFMTQLKCSLRSGEPFSNSSSDVDFKLSGDNLQLTIKETLGTTSTKSVLFKSTLVPVEDSQQSFMSIFAEISVKIRSDEANASTLNKTIAEYIQQVDILSANTKEMGTMKDKLQDELVSKMCMVLNCKKREIERLNQRVAELENAAPSESENTTDVIDLTEGSAAPAGTKKAARAQSKPRATKAKATAAPRGGGTSISATARGSKRKAVSGAAIKKAAAAKRRRGESESESEDRSEDGSDGEGSLADFIENDDGSEEAEGDDGNGSDGSREAHSDNESDHSEARPPQVTPGSPPATSMMTTASQSHGVSSAVASGGTVRKGAGKGASKSSDGAGAAKAAAAVSLSLPLAEDTLPVNGLKGTDNNDSDSDGPLIKWRSRPEPAAAGPSSAINGGGAANNGSNGNLARTVTKAGATQSTKGASNNSAAGFISKISNGATSIAAKGGALSKFYGEENSEDEGNCMNYM